MYLLIVLSALILRVHLIIRDSVPFAYDMGRDLLWVKDIAFYGIPTLIGPAASIWGVYFGPFWYYFLAFPFLLSNGHPMSAVYATSLTIVITGLLAFLLFKNILGKTLALMLSVVILFGANLINISTFAFHANLLPLLTILMIYFCFLSVVKNPKYLSLAFLSTGLMFSADPAPAVVFSFIPPTIFFYFKIYKSKISKKVVALSLVAYAMPFVPQIIFELRNNFIQTKSLIAYFLGDNPSLSGQLPFLPRVVDRIEVFLDFFASSFTGNNKILALIILAGMIIGAYNFTKVVKDQKILALFKINLICLFSIFLIFTILFTVEVKNWYLYGATIPFAFILTFALFSLRRQRFLLYLLISAYLVVNVGYFATLHKKNLSLNDPAQLKNQLSVIDLIYEDANKPFSVYTFTPPIYDLNFQYLFWWQGVILKKGLPQDFTYLPQKPDYVRNKNLYARNAQTSNLVYLIIENAPENEFYSKNDWLKNFKKYKIVWEKNINDAITVQKRVR